MRIPGFITRNFRLKVGCALLAVIVWAGVVYAGNPPEQRVIPVPVPQQPAQVPAGYQLVRPITALQLRIGGTRDSLNAFSPAMLTVNVAWNTVRHAGVQQLPISISNSDSAVELIDPPASVTADIDAIASTAIPVTIRYSAYPPPGYVISAQSATPSSVVVTGPQHELPDLQVVVTVDLANRKSNVDEELQPLVYDSHGDEIGDVGMNPSGAVRVTITISSAEATRAVAVVPRLEGTVAPGWELVSVTVSPQIAVLSGPQDLLNGLDFVPTTPLPLYGMTGQVSRSLDLVLPAGVTSAPVYVTVILNIRPLPPSTPSPSPAATPTAPA